MSRSAPEVPPLAARLVRAFGAAGIWQRASLWPRHLGGVIPATVLLLVTSEGHAHHSPGHGPSESLRALTLNGASLAPRQRAAVVGEVTRSSDEPSLNTATIGSLTASVNLALTQRLYLDLNAPVLLVDEDASEGVKVGSGNASLGVSYLLSPLDAPSEASWTLGTSLSFPTRTVRFVSDPGRQWSLSPAVRYADGAASWLWYGMLLLPVEIRPTGTAFEGSLALGLGYQFTRRWSLSLGAGVDVRLLTLCRSVSGTEVCRQGRSSEADRAVGTARVFGNVSSFVDLSKNWSLFANGQLPLTSRRDVEWSVGMGVEARF